MNRVQRFNYEGFEITFNGGDNVLVNATQMARPFNKRPAKWLELPSTQEFLDSLMDIRSLNNQEFSSVRLSDTSNSPFVKTIMGSPSSGGGTWMHEDVASQGKASSSRDKEITSIRIAISFIVLRTSYQRTRLFIDKHYKYGNNR